MNECCVKLSEKEYRYIQLLQNIALCGPTQVEIALFLMSTFIRRDHNINGQIWWTVKSRLKFFIYPIRFCYISWHGKFRWEEFLSSQKAKQNI